MNEEESIPLTCPKCRHVSSLPVRVVQENVFYTCSRCSAMVMIDKDEATKVLAAHIREPR